MAREIPEVVRAAAGLAATVLDEARKLPEALPGLPVRVIGLAMQQAMKVQQQYAGFVARGDELFTGLRGADEPGLATFDDDDDAAQPATGGFRESAFDRADAPTGDGQPAEFGDEQVAQLPADPPADAVTSVVDELASQVEDGRQSIQELVEEAPEIEEILDEIAIDELVDAGLDETAPATVTDEGVAATATDEGGTPVAAALDAGDEAGRPVPATAPATAPIDGYDGFSVAQLRGRLRGYQLATVQDLVSYEEGTRSRAPYLRMLRNRLEKLEQQAVESSPLAPRGA
jgi:hypothetical protein